MISSALTGLLLITGLTTSAMGQMAQDGFDVDPKLKVSKVAYSSMQAVFDFVKVFQKTHDRLPTEELVGFHGGTDGKEYEVGVYHLVNPTRLAASLFDCHFHFEDDGSIENAHCHDEKKQAVNDYEAAKRTFKIEEYQIALVEAVEYFGKKHGNADLIQDLKMWHGNESLEFAIVKKGAEEGKKIFIMCHYHGDHIDCHGRSRPGPHQPGDA